MPENFCGLFNMEKQLSISVTFSGRFNHEGFGKDFRFVIDKALIVVIIDEI